MWLQEVKYVSKKILIVDDEPDIHTLLNHYLQKIEGVEIINALSGEEAIRIYKEMMERGDRPLLVILDLNLSASEFILLFFYFSDNLHIY